MPLPCVLGLLILLLEWPPLAQLAGFQFAAPVAVAAPVTVHGAELATAPVSAAAAHDDAAAPAAQLSATRLPAAVHLIQVPHLRGAAVSGQQDSPGD